jgi:RHS repeat-associated protein
MTWGYENELLTAQPPSGDMVTMTYDGDHLRRKRQDASGVTKHVWDEQQILLETNGNNVTQARYTLAPLGYGDLVSMRRDGATRFCHFDRAGSTRELTDATEAVTDTYLYDAWGDLVASNATALNPYQYIGKLGYTRESVYDGYYVRRRHYAPGIGRFLSRDPAGSTDGPYVYAGDRPALLVDPSGLDVDGQIQCIIDLNTHRQSIRGDEAKCAAKAHKKYSDCTEKCFYIALCNAVAGAICEAGCVLALRHDLNKCHDQEKKDLAQAVADCQSCMKREDGNPADCTHIGHP